MSELTLAVMKWIALLIEEAYNEVVNLDDLVLGRYDFRGRREVFVGSRYYGAISEEGVFFADRTPAEPTDADVDPWVDGSHH